MGFNDSYYKREVNALLNECIRELRRHGCEDEPTNDYKFNKNLLNAVNLYPFKQLDDMIADMLYENETITVADAGVAANVFMFMAYLSSEGIINNFEEEEDEYDENGIRYAKKERVCYPLITLLFADKCDYYMLGSRIFPRVIMGGLADLKNLVEKWQKEYKINLPSNVDLDKFCDTLYLSFVPNPDNFDAMVTPFFNKRANRYLAIEAKYPESELSSLRGKRNDYMRWFKNMKALHCDISVDPSLNVTIW